MKWFGSMFGRACFGCLLLHFCLGVHTAAVKSVTHDELWHFPVGILNLSRGEFGHDRLNPPLTRIWAALPAVLCGVRADAAESPVAIGHAFVAKYSQTFHFWYVSGRLMNLLVSIGLGWLLACESRALWGDYAGLLAVALYCAEPTMLANACLVTPDVGLCFTVVLVFALFRRWFVLPSIGKSLVLGGALGLALGAKFTAVLLIPWLAVGLLVWVIRQRASWSSLRIAAVHTLGVGAMSWLILQAIYGFREDSPETSMRELSGPAIKLVVQKLGPFDFVMSLLPKDYLLGIDEQATIMSQFHPSYLDGEWSSKGWGDYFLWALTYKLPIVHQALFVLACGMLVYRVFQRQPVCSCVIAIGALFPLLLLKVTSGSQMLLGVRYVLPVIPLGIFFVSSVATSWPAWSDRWKTYSGLVVGSMMGVALCQHPHHLAYFNEIWGASSQGTLRLIDSNIDWGQDLYLLRDYVRQKKIETLRLVYFGTLPPQSIGLNYTVPQPFQVEPGWYAISMNYVAGRPHTVLMPNGGSRAMPMAAMSIFQTLFPIENLGGSILVYHIKPQDLPRIQHDLDAIQAAHQFRTVAP